MQLKDHKKDLLVITALLGLLILFFSKILFTDKVLSAPDIINEFYWGVVAHRDAPFTEIFDFGKIKSDWNIFINGGTTSEGGIAPIHFLFWFKLIFHVIPAPASVAWFIVLHLVFAAAGLYLYCRIIGLSRPAAFLAGLIFAIAPENASLINAGHVMKIATIAYAPWALYFIERGFRSQRVIFFLATGLTLALQFFNTHWQIAFYTCLTIGLYGLIRSLVILYSRGERSAFPVPKLIGMNLVVLCFFLSTVSIGLLPLANWAKDTNRGVQSGENQGKGGLGREEAMSWSLPPEELGALVIPGLFGLSRQEGGENPSNIASYYWGRMRFTQTVSYFGLLPLLLLPLPLIFRRDRYTWLALGGVLFGLLFSMGQYTPFYNALFDHFPGINRFRVPKMMMFVPVMGVGVLSAIAIDLLRDEGIRKSQAFRRYLFGIIALPVVLLVLLGIEVVGKGFWINAFVDQLSQPTRYEQGPQLVLQRWNNLMVETGIAAGFAAGFAAVFGFFGRGRLPLRIFFLLLFVLFLVDVGRINDKFMFLIKVPEKAMRVETPLMEFVGRSSKQFRVLPLDGEDPMLYVSHNIPVMYTSNAVQQVRWQQFLDAFSFDGAMPDIMNVKYLIMQSADYLKQKTQMGSRYAPVFTSTDGATVVLENRMVLPKGWLVPSVAVIKDPAQRVGILQNPGFNPSVAALVEEPPPVAMAEPNNATPLPQDVRVPVYEGEHIVVEATTPRNALLVLGEKYYRGWKATVDDAPAEIVPVDHILRGVYLTPGTHKIEFKFDPLPFKIGKWLTLASFAIFAVLLAREIRFWRRKDREGLHRDGQTSVE